LSTFSEVFLCYIDIWFLTELQQKVGKLYIPYFDGFIKCIARAWVQKLDTYFQLNLIMDIEAIKYDTLHLDGEAHEWWYHGLVVEISNPNPVSSLKETT
jgi:hypothetical protein